MIYKDVCNPITAEFREELYTNILDAYARIKEPEKEETQKQDRTQGTKGSFEMPEFSVTVTPYEREGSNIKGLARIYFENSFIVNNINIVQGKEKIFVSMPSYKTKQVDEQGKPIYQDVCYPVTKDFREKLYNEIISEYEKAKDKSNERLLDIRENVRGAIKTTDTDIAKTALLAKGFREAGQTAANAFRTFADKPEVDYSQKEQKHPLTKAVLTPMKAVRKLLVSMELHLDASIDKLDNLAMNVQIDKEKRVENTKSEKQNVPDRAEAEPERVNAEIVYTPMVAEAHEYQYNADAFEARGGADVKVGTAEKVSKVREDKAR